MKARSLAAAFLLLVPFAAFAKSDAMSLIPNDAVTVGVVHLAELRTSPLSSTLFQQTDKLGGAGEGDRFLSDAGLDPAKDVDLLVVATSPRTTLGSEADVLVAAEGRFNVERLTKALVERGAIKKDGYYLLPIEREGSGQGAVAFADAHLAIAGSEQAVTEALAARAAGGTTFTTSSGLGRELARMDPKATAWAVVDVTRAARLTGTAHVSDKNPLLASAVKNVSTVALWATDTGDALKLGAFGVARDAETLDLVEDAVRGALATARLAVADKSPDMVSVLRRFSVSRTNDSVTITGSIPAEALRKLVVQQRAAK